MTRPYFLKCITLQNGAISAIIYFIATVVSLSIVHMDDKINLYSHNASLWEDEPVSSS